MFGDAAWAALAAKGARTQRVLWASTGTKNPAYRDVVYVEELIGPDTVNTAPPATVDLFRDHGLARPSLAEGVEEARATLAAISRAGISLAEVTERLLEEGLKLFVVPFDKLLEAVEKVRLAALGAGGTRHPPTLSAPLASALRAATDAWQAGGKIDRKSVV